MNNSSTTGAGRLQVVPTTPEERARANREYEARRTAEAKALAARGRAERRARAVASAASAHAMAPSTLGLPLHKDQAANGCESQSVYNLPAMLQARRDQGDGTPALPGYVRPSTPARLLVPLMPPSLSCLATT